MCVQCAPKTSGRFVCCCSHSISFFPSFLPPLCFYFFLYLMFPAISAFLLSLCPFLFLHSFPSFFHFLFLFLLLLLLSFLFFRLLLSVILLSHFIFFFLIFPLLFSFASSSVPPDPLIEEDIDVKMDYETWRKLMVRCLVACCYRDVITYFPQPITYLLSPCCPPCVLLMHHVCIALPVFVTDLRIVDQRC